MMISLMVQRGHFKFFLKDRIYSIINLRMIRKSLKNYSYILSANLLTHFVGIISLSYFLRIFSKTEIAFFPVAIILGDFSNLLLNFGFFPTMIKIIPPLIDKDEEKIKKILFTVFFFSALNGILFAFIIFFFSENISYWVFRNTLQSYNLKIFSSGILFFSLWQFFQYTFRAFSEFKILSQILVFQNLTRIILIVFFSFWFKELAIILGIVLSMLFSNILAFRFFKRYFIGIQGFYNLKELFQESIPFYLEGYIMYFRGQGDNLVITYFIGAEGLSIYYVAQKIFLFTSGVLSALYDVVVSQLSRFKNDVLAYQKKLNELSDAYLYILLPFFSYALSFSPFILEIVAGKKYYQAIMLGTIMGLEPIIQYFYGLIFGVNVFLLDKSINRMKFTLFYTLILIILMFLLVSSFSLWGIVFARILASNVTGLYIYKLSKNLNMLPNIKYSKLLNVLIISAILFMQNIFWYLLKINIFLLIIINFLVLIFSIYYMSLNIKKEFYNSLKNLFSVDTQNVLNKFIK